MVGLAEYFGNIRYMGKWFLGDRVFGHYNKIPFIGTVGNDFEVNETVGPQVTIHLDLPIIVDNVKKNVILVKPKDIKRLVEF